MNRGIYLQWNQTTIPEGGKESSGKQTVTSSYINMCINVRQQFYIRIHTSFSEHVITVASGWMDGWMFSSTYVAWEWGRTRWIDVSHRSAEIHIHVLFISILVVWTWSWPYICQEQGDLFQSPISCLLQGKRSTPTATKESQQSSRLSH